MLDIYTFEKLAILIAKELQKAQLLSYIPDDAIKIYSASERDFIPEFENYIVRITPPDSGFVNRNAKIGQYIRNEYTVAIDFWIKKPSELAKHSLIGNTQVNKSIYTVFQDIVSILEHNTFNNQLVSYPGSNIGDSVSLSSDNTLIEGIGFLWFGYQDTKK